MQSTLSPEKETMSLLNFCRRLSADETAVIEAARVALFPPARARRSRRDLDTEDVSDVDDYDDDDDLPSDTNGSRRYQISNEMKVQEDIAEACLQIIAHRVTEVACSSACAILRKGTLLPASFLAQEVGKALLAGEIRAELYSERQFSWRRGRRVEKAISYGFEKGNIVVVLPSAVDRKPQEYTSGTRNRDETPNGDPPDIAAPSTKSRRNMQIPFLIWYRKQPAEVQCLGPGRLRNKFMNDTREPINERTIQRALRWLRASADGNGLRRTNDF